MEKSTFIKNAHSVPLTDLITLNTVAIATAIYVAKRYWNLDNMACLGLGVLLFSASAVIHPKMNIPDNFSRYVGLGEKPEGWRGS